MDNKRKLMAFVFILFFIFLLLPLGILWLLRRILLKHKWWSPTLGSIFSFGVVAIVSFGTIYVEMYFLMQSTFNGYCYYTLDWLLLVFFVNIVISGQIAILYGYIQLVYEGRYSWWCQFFASGSVSIVVLVYSFFFFESLDVTGWYATLVYFTTMVWVCLVLFLMLGFVGLITSIWFVNVALRIVQNGQAQSLLSPPNSQN